MHVWECQERGAGGECTQVGETRRTHLIIDGPQNSHENGDDALDDSDVARSKIHYRRACEAAPPHALHFHLERQDAVKPEKC